MILGTGFAPFRGGPLNYLASLQADGLKTDESSGQNKADTQGETA
jgi:hypothetical protein